MHLQIIIATNSNLSYSSPSIPLTQPTKISKVLTRPFKNIYSVDTSKYLGDIFDRYFQNFQTLIIESKNHKPIDFKPSRAFNPLFPCHQY